MGQNPKSEIRNPKSKRLVPLLLDWFAANARDLPWRRTRDPYAIWVSEIMLQQTQVKTVIPFWERWLRELPTIEAAAKAPSAKIHKLWEGLGYYTRVRNLQKAAQAIVKHHDGKFPENFDEVLALPGIGRYTAGAICSIAFNQPKPILDGNVIRVLTRIFGIADNPKEKAANAKLWQLAEALVSIAGEIGGARLRRAQIKSHGSTESRHTQKETCSHLNQSLMELGALICTPRNPQCLICPVKKLCVAFKENRTAELPNLGKREAATARRFVAFVVEHGGKFLVRQRPAQVVNAHLWEFPNVEVGVRLCEPQEFWAEFAALPANDPRSENLERLCIVKHSITRYRITLEAFFVQLKNAPAENGGIWQTSARLKNLAFTSAHRKVLRAVIARAGN